MNLGYVISAFLALLGFAAYQTIKRNNADAQLKNNDVLKDTSKNQGLLDAEEEKRKEIETTQITTTTIQKLLDFFNKK